VQPVTGLLETAPSNYHAYNFGGGFDDLFSPNLILDVRAGAMLKRYVFDSRLAAAGTHRQRRQVSRMSSNTAAC
jgi:hypothetical protein